MARHDHLHADRATGPLDERRLTAVTRDDAPVSRQTADHYTWGDGCDGWHLVRSPALAVIEERMPPGTAEARHRHAVARQFFFVLAGELTIEREGTVLLLRAGEGLEVAPGSAHQVLNHGRDDARFLVISQPPSHGDRELVPRASDG